MKFESAPEYEKAIVEGDFGHEINPSALEAAEAHEEKMEQLNITADQIAQLEQELAKPDLPKELRVLFEKLVKNKGGERITLH